MKGDRSLESYVGSLKLTVARVDAARLPDLRSRLAAMAFEAEALAVDHPEFAAELNFIVGYIRRML